MCDAKTVGDWKEAVQGYCAFPTDIDVIRRSVEFLEAPVNFRTSIGTLLSEKGLLKQKLRSM